MMPDDGVDFSVEDILQVDEGEEDDDIPEMDEEDDD
jgi:hypothetical protein